MELISRKVIMDYLREEQAKEIIDSHKDDFAVNNTLDMINAFINFVVQVPSEEEYIISEIEDEIEYSQRLYQKEEIDYRNGLRKAIRIIKKGEWRNE